MTSLILLTGFLGAGKTTLMKRLLDCYREKRIGVIINEFGSINIDARLVETDGVQMAELSNGSIFCACIKDRFVDSLIDMAARNLEYLFIEASGLADPASMEIILAGISHLTDNKLLYRGSICIADAENYRNLADLLPAIRSQTEYADAVILNKTDLIDCDDLEKVEMTIRGFNSEVQIYPATYCNVDIRKIIDRMGDKSAHIDARESSNTWQNRANTFCVQGTDTIPYIQLEAFLKEIIGGSYRIKGFALTDQGNKEISTVGVNMHINDWDNPLEATEIIIISSIGFAMLSKIARALDTHLKGLLDLKL